jgi:hypothetical protein
MIANKKHGRLSQLLIQFAAMGQDGRSCTARTFIVSSARDPTSDYCRYYWSLAHSYFGIPFDVWCEVATLSYRYRRFCRYVEETKPQWREMRKIFYADNSIEVVEASNDGRMRQRMVEAPHGDACF